MYFAGFLPLLVLLAIQKPADGNVCDNIWPSLETINYKLDSLTNIIANQARTIENQAKSIDNQAKTIEELKAELNKTQLSNAAIEAQLRNHSAEFLIHDNRLKSHDTESDARDSQLLKSIYGAELGPRDCADIRVMNHTKNGTYTVFPGSDDKRIEAKVFCEFGHKDDSWLVLQRRKDGSVDFERKWDEYERGFGDLNGEFWLGNDIIYRLTSNRKYKLRIELEDFAGQKRYALYSRFSVGPATDKYRITVTGYSGNAGGDSLAKHNGMRFTTKDDDNDPMTINCAELYRGAWWHYDCHNSHLNGLYLRGQTTNYAQGITWYHWHGFYYSLKTTEMKIAPLY